MNYLNIYEKKNKQTLDFLRSSIVEYSDYNVLLKRYTGKDELKVKILNAFKDSLFLYLKEAEPSSVDLVDPKYYYTNYSFCVQYFKRYYRSFLKYRDILEDFGLQLFTVDHFSALYERYLEIDIQLKELINHFNTL